MTTILSTDGAIVEDARTQARRRFQQKRCLVCGARQLHNQATSFFCSLHITTHRYCSTCETLRTTEEHGKDSRCKACARVRGLAAYHADPERHLYRLKLAQLAKRSETRGDQIFAGIRRRIALATFVANTPHWSWMRRGRFLGVDETNLAERYRQQTRGNVRDADAAERERKKQR